MLADTGPTGERVQQASASMYDKVREAALTGVAVVVPLLVTLYVMSVAAGVITDLLDPLVDALDKLGMTPNASELLVDAFGVLGIVALTLLVGFVASFRSGERVLEYFDAALERIPGLGAVYKSFRQMSDVMLESDADNFQEVVLVEYPAEETYTLGFRTTETPDAIEAAAGREGMETLFLPLAPNPVMGGFLAHVPGDRVRDVDMTVEEGIRTIVTTGVATAETDAGSAEGLSRARLEQLTGQDVPEVSRRDGGGSE
ncbi:DUF502 domain-containing protein [Halobacterium zhouii]|uniref:DUF502 domain-containing protein n=1 Tax=Halobacterium zhouii TaxID=2902624 RepID=UPI001E38DBF8|nr:DUF502 domain-containing protein [Halobacterium zhouii]